MVHFFFFSSGSSNEDTSVSLAPQISLRTEWSTNSACLTCSKSAANSSTSWASVVFFSFQEKDELVLKQIIGVKMKNM